MSLTSKCYIFWWGLSWYWCKKFTII